MTKDEAKELRESLIKYIDEVISKAQNPKELIIGKKYRVVNDIDYPRDNGGIFVCKRACKDMFRNGVQVYDFECSLNYHAADQVELVEDEKLPYNAWYKGFGGSVVFLESEDVGYGFLGGTVWENKSDSWAYLNGDNKVWTPCGAPIDLLTKEAERRGYKDGVRVISMVDKNEYILNHIKPKFACFDGGLRMGGVLIMKDGIWAEIIDDKIKIGGYKLNTY
jgi:hypothetical protein